MALIVFLRGVNVGGHRRLRPSVLARDLSEFGVVNVGAAGTFVVSNPKSRAKFRSKLRRKIPFETEVVFCDGRDLIRWVRENPFQNVPIRSDLVRFVSVLSKPSRVRPSLPISVPRKRGWFVRVIGSKHPFVFGVYRRHMKTIRCLSQIDKLFGVSTTTRSWKTITEIVRILEGRDRTGIP